MSEKRFVCIDVGYGDDWYITDNGERLYGIYSIKDFEESFELDAKINKEKGI